MLTLMSTGPSTVSITLAYLPPLGTSNGPMKLSELSLLIINTGRVYIEPLHASLCPGFTDTHPLKFTNFWVHSDSLQPWRRVSAPNKVPLGSQYYHPRALVQNRLLKMGTVPFVALLLHCKLRRFLTHSCFASEYSKRQKTFQKIRLLPHLHLHSYTGNPPRL